MNKELKQRLLDVLEIAQANAIQTLNNYVADHHGDGYPTKSHKDNIETYSKEAERTRQIILEVKALD